MKKFFTLIAAVAMAASMNAQTEWNFSNWDAKTYSETFTKDGLTLNINKNSKGEDAPMTIDGKLMVIRRLLTMLSILSVLSCLVLVLFLI